MSEPLAYQAPHLVILDEPTNGLDPTQINQMRGLIRELAQSATVIISTHILQEVQAVCERVLIMRAGKMVLDSRMDALQAGQHLKVTLDNPNASDYLQQVEGVRNVASCQMSEPLACYSLDANEEAAPLVAKAVAEAGDRLFSLQPEVRTLETIFAEVNESHDAARQEAA